MNKIAVRISFEQVPTEKTQPKNVYVFIQDY